MISKILRKIQFMHVGIYTLFYYLLKAFKANYCREKKRLSCQFLKLLQF
jgi:hypothetical protein